MTEHIEDDNNSILIDSNQDGSINAFTDKTNRLALVYRGSSGMTIRKLEGYNHICFIPSSRTSFVSKDLEVYGYDIDRDDYQPMAKLYRIRDCKFKEYNGEIWAAGWDEDHQLKVYILEGVKIS